MNLAVKIKLFLSPYSNFSELLQLKIQDRIDKGEQISAFIQSAVVLFMLSVWLISPRGNNFNDHAFATIPLVLGCYSPFLCLRIYLAYQKKITTAVSSLFTIIDVFLILATVWLYHVEYKQPPSMSLQVSTFQFLALMIALRCLSFKPLLVLLATVIACLGWIAMTWYAIKHPETLLTRSFIEYTLSNKILIGSEVEKIMALFVTGLTMTVAVRNAATMLGESVDAKNQTDALSRFFNLETAKLIKSGELEIKAGYGHKRVATVLFIDLRGFTKMSQQLDPDSIMRLLSEYHEIVLPVIFKNNGSIDKFMGDGILVHFGAIADSQTHAADCLRCIDEIVNSVQVWNNERFNNNLKPININMAAASGLVIFGATGNGSRLEMTTLGATVNLASKLEKVNKKFNSISVVNDKLVELSQVQNYRSKFAYTYEQSFVGEGIDQAQDIYYLKSTDVINIKVSA